MRAKFSAFCLLVEIHRPKLITLMNSLVYFRNLMLTDIDFFGFLLGSRLGIVSDGSTGVTNSNFVQFVGPVFCNSFSNVYTAPSKKLQQLRSAIVK